MRGVYGSHVQYRRQTVVADDAYMSRIDFESERKNIVAGFKPDVMPTFRDRLAQEGCCISCLC